MDLSWFAFPIAWATALGGPILTLVIAVRYYHEDAHARRLARRAAILFLLVTTAWFVSVETIWRPVNWLALVAGYGAWCTLVGLVLTLRPRWLGIIAGSALGTTLLPGLLLGTVGFLALPFIVGDYGRPPLRRLTLAPGLDCVETNWGMAANDDGHTIHLYRYWPWLPVVRRQVRHIIVNDTEPQPGIPATLHCTMPKASR